VKLIQKLRESWLTHQEIDELEEYVKQLEIDANRYKWLNKYTSQLFMVTEKQTDQQVDIAMGKNMTEDEAWDELERKQTKKWNASDMAYRPNGLTIDDDIQEYKKPWVGLTDKDIDDFDIYSGDTLISLVHAIEAKLKELNNG
jgi:hypothetical protein